MASQETIDAVLEVVASQYVTAIQLGMGWRLLCGFLVFFMHVGFACLEAGAVREKNTVNILFKNVMTVCIGVVCYFFVGWAWAYGLDNAADPSAKFIGSGDYALSSQIHDSRGITNADRSYKSDWFFQMVFAATAATIVSGAVAERTKLVTYFIFSAYLVGFVYPVVSHWVWANGWLSAFVPPDQRLFYNQPGWGNGTACGMIDFAGSGVVHLVGGTAALVGAIMVGPRKGRFATDPATGKYTHTLPMPGHSFSLVAQGTMYLWFGWYGFNCGSTLIWDGPLSSKVAVTTSLGAACGGLTGVFAHKALSGQWDLGVLCNCVLVGLVSITAGCSVVEDWMVIFIGAIGAFMYMGCSALMRTLHIDDPLDAVAVHGAGGLWGVLAVGIFGTKENIEFSYLCDGGGNSNGMQFATQLVGALSIIAWVGANSVLLFGLLKLTIGVRVSDVEEEEGLDTSEHGAVAYELSYFDRELQSQREPHVKRAPKAVSSGKPAEATGEPIIGA